MIKMMKWSLFSAAVFLSLNISAQPKPVIPIMRKIFHENIDRAQRWVDRLDKKEDKAFNITKDEEVNQQLTYSLYTKVDELQDKIELDSTLNSNDKIKELRGITEALNAFESGYRYRLLKAVQLPELIDALTEAFDLDKRQQSIAPIIYKNEYEIGNIIVKSIAFQKNPGIVESKDDLVLKYCRKYPKNIMGILRTNPDVRFADSLIYIVAFSDPEAIYNYAQSTSSRLGQKINNSEVPLVKTIVRLASSNEGRMYFPFLDNLYRNRVSIEEIDKAKENVLSYYRLLVNTQIDYAERLRRRDTPLGMDALTGMLRQKAIDEFVNVINGLHDSPDPIRMKAVEPLTPQELYYLCVMSETEIYTSSYLKVYDRIFQRMKHPNSDSLLMSVRYDHFKKFIKMAANYNKLDDFLKRMDKGNAEILMRSFANSLEKTNSLEDAVDVADSYASISDKKLRNLILEEVQANAEQQVKDTASGRRGFAIYDLLNNLFQSLDSSKHIDLATKFQIPSIYSIANGDLKNADGKIIIQQFFYGDKDGEWQFNLFKRDYSGANWKIVDKPEWIELTSTKSTIPVVIYANKPLDEKEGLDEKAQDNLTNFLGENNLDPTIVIHRGHSYHVSSTIKQLFPSCKVVLLGSCGGYQNINRVLSISPYAHIIASKQTGSGKINAPMIMNITDLLRQGKDIQWQQMWQSLGKTLGDNPLFQDYIPPYKNLGALFIMAYNRVMEG